MSQIYKYETQMQCVLYDFLIWFSFIAFFYSVFCSSRTRTKQKQCYCTFLQRVTCMLTKQGYGIIKLVCWLLFGSGEHKGLQKNVLLLLFLHTSSRSNTPNIKLIISALQMHAGLIT